MARDRISWTGSPSQMDPFIQWKLEEWIQGLPQARSLQSTQMWSHGQQRWVWNECSVVLEELKDVSVLSLSTEIVFLVEMKGPGRGVNIIFQSKNSQDQSQDLQVRARKGLKPWSDPDWKWRELLLLSADSTGPVAPRVWPGQGLVPLFRF